MTDAHDDFQRPDVWPEWDRTYRQLAQFVSLDGARRANLSDASTFALQLENLDPIAGRREVAAALYGALKDRAVPYALAPWNREERQIIRDPEWLVQEAGTCIDFACAFAAMCLEATVAPYVAFTASGRHAYLVLDLQRNLASDDPQATSASAGLIEPHVLQLDPDRSELIELIDSGALLPLDPTEAQRNGSDFDDAVRNATDLLVGGEGNRAVLVDIAGLHSDGVEPLLAPQNRRALRAFLPSAPHFEPFPSRKDVITDLARPGRVVLHGAAGTGKSRLAREVAASWNKGSGWFLDASDPETLTTSLATAELFEVGDSAGGDAERGGALELIDRQGYAAAAIERLNQTSAPWVVVLDNANGAPGELQSQLPRPRPDLHQLVLVTTTNAAWTTAPGFASRELEALTDAEVASYIGVPTETTWLLDLVAGRPLLAQAFQALVRAGGDLTAPPVELPTLRGDEVDGARGFWTIVKAGRDLTVLAAARIAAWLPADHIDPKVVEDIVAGGRESLAELQIVGLLSRVGDAYTMHRLFGQAIRELEEEHRHADVLGLATTPSARDSLDDHGDRATVDALTDELISVAETAGVDRKLAVALHALAVVQELHGRTARSAELYTLAREGFDEASPDDMAYVADCLHGEARLVNQQQANNARALEDAIESMKRTEQLRNTLGDPVGEARGRALRGLLRQKQAAFARGDAKEAVLLDAKTIIDDSYDERRKAFGTDDHAEVIRGYFNKAGVRIQLAKMDPERAEGLLREVDDIYRTAGLRRARLYRRPVHPHIAACTHGRGIVSYYQAVLVPRRTQIERSEWLREATTYVAQALTDRSVLDGAADGPEVSKSAHLLAKIQLARRLSVTDPGQRQLGKALGDANDVVEQVIDEIYGTS